jgi:hypothetical protein
MTATKARTTKKPKAGTKKGPARNGKATKSHARGKRMSALEAAAKVLSEEGVAMTCPDLIGVMAAKGYWSSPAGKTPAATLSAAIGREIATKGTDSRFTKAAPGRFAANGAPAAPKGHPATAAGKARRRPGKGTTAATPGGASGPTGVTEPARA